MTICSRRCTGLAKASAITARFADPHRARDLRFGASELRWSALLTLSENDVPFDPYSARTLDPDFSRMLFENGTCEIDSSGGGSKSLGGLKRATFSAQSPFNHVRHNFYLKRSLASRLLARSNRERHKCPNFRIRLRYRHWPQLGDVFSEEIGGPDRMPLVII
jgi:hypothetical protein